GFRFAPPQALCWRALRALRRLTYINKLKHDQTRTRCQCVLFVLILTGFALWAPRNLCAQTVNVDRVVSELEPEIQRMMLAGNIPSCSIALISGDKVIWSNAYGYTNLWA